MDAPSNVARQVRTVHIGDRLGAPPAMYACPHCNAIDKFMAFKGGVLIRVLEDHEDVEGLDKVNELLCIECNKWFPNPQKDPHKRKLVGELVSITGLTTRG